jgi:ribosomal protein S18 acetylase RimI-like enzyme
MNIREFEAGDQTAVVSLWEDCGLVAPQNDPVKDIQRKLLVNPELFLVGVFEGKIVATVMGGYEGHRGWINYLAVSPNHQHAGYGRAIMAAVEERIRAVGCPKINLQVRSSNEAVIQFYESLGYGQDRVVGMGKRLESD